MQNTLLEKTNPIYELERVTVILNHQPILNDINMQIRSGERIALLGPSGVGKTTLLKLLNFSLFPTEGNLKIFGQDIRNIHSKDLRKIQQNIGSLYQDLRLIESIYVIHNINVGLLARWSSFKSLFSLFWPQNTSGAMEILRKMGLEDKLFEKTMNLSGGQKQFVALARILCQDPEIIIADEPISNLDSERSKLALDLLLNGRDKPKKTVITALHQVEFAFQYFDRILLLGDGTVKLDTCSKNVSPEMVTSLYAADLPKERGGEEESFGSQSVIPKFGGLRNPQIISDLDTLSTSKSKY